MSGVEGEILKIRVSRCNFEPSMRDQNLIGIHDRKHEIFSSRKKK